MDRIAGWDILDYVAGILCRQKLHVEERTMVKRTLVLVLDFNDDDPNVDVTMEQVYENVLENVGDLLETRLPDTAAKVYLGDPTWLLDGNKFVRQI